MYTDLTAASSGNANPEQHSENTIPDPTAPVVANDMGPPPVAKASHPNKAAWATWLHEQGFYLFMLKADKPGDPNVGKRPAYRGGCHTATRDLDLILHELRQNPFANLGIAYWMSGHCLIELDVKDGLANGVDSWNELCAEPPETLAWRSWSGGIHMIFRDPEGVIRNSAGKLGLGIDTRGEGGYGVAPGSVVGGKPYEILVDAPIAELPAWVAERYGRAPETRENQGGPYDEAWAVEYARSEIENGSGQWANVPVEGQRNNSTFGRAVRLHGLGVPEPVALEMLREWCQRGQMPDEPIETFIEGAYHDRPRNEFGSELPPNPSDSSVFQEAIDAMPKGDAGDWPEPVDVFGDELRPEPELRETHFPQVIRDWAWDEAERLGVEPAMLAIPAIVTFAAAIDNRIEIQPKERDTTWKESAILWGLLISPPGGRKTPALNKTISPLRSIEQEWRSEDGRKLAEYQDKLDAYKAQQKQKSLDGEEPLVRPDKPIERRATVNDVGMEKLAEILEFNERGLLAFYDEITVFIGGFDAYRSNGAQKDRPLALELWNGHPRQVDRKTAGSSHNVPRWGAGVLGGTQPDKLRQLAQKDGLVIDGFLQRFLLFGAKTIGRGTDREPDKAAIARYYERMRGLAALTPDGPLFPRTPITLSPEARPHWKRVEELAEALANEKALPAALRNHMSKAAGLCARLMLTFHMIECGRMLPSALIGAATVSEATAKRACDLMTEYFIPQAIRTFGELCPIDDGEAGILRNVARVILATDGDKITDRDIYRGSNQLRGAGNAGLRGQAMQAFAGYGWVRLAADGWLINPKIARFEQQRAEAREHNAKEHARATEARRVWTKTYGKRPG